MSSRMTNVSQLLELIGAIYDAAVDPALWPVFLAQFAQACGSSTTLFFMHDFANGGAAVEADPSAITAHVHIGPEYIQSFAEHYNSVNVWVKNEETLPEGIAVTSDMLFPNALLPSTEWYGDYLRPQNLFYALGGIVVRQGTRAVKFTSLRSRRQGDFGKDQMSLYEMLIPHIRRACALHLQFSKISGMQQAGLHLLDTLAVGVILLDSSARAMFVNRAAREIVQQKDGLLLDFLGRCSASISSESRRLQTLVAKAICTGIGIGIEAGGTISLSRRNSARPLSVLVSPLPTQGLKHKFQVGFSPVATLLIGDPDKAVRSPVEVIAGLYGLTPAEANLASGLVGGLTLDQYAQTQQISRNTAATHLKRILSKTGTRRQSEFVKILLTGPAAHRLIAL